ATITDDEELIDYEFSDDEDGFYEEDFVEETPTSNPRYLRRKPAKKYDALYHPATPASVVGSHVP
ncbi:Hypothetical protein FKW44_014560, partial [Caligus rogercresseyi]